MSQLTQSFELPTRRSEVLFHGVDECLLSQLERQVQLLMNLVARVKQLKYVNVKNIPFITNSGDTVMIPGPLSLNIPRVEKTEEESELEETTSLDGGEQKFVVRNEFGHIRMQPLLEYLEHFADDAQTDARLNPKAIEVGGHCVVPDDVFVECIQKGWGQKHPFGGRYHPITGTMIPANTLLFFAPRTKEEYEVIWKIVAKSYEWATSDFLKELM